MECRARLPQWQEELRRDEEEEERRLERDLPVEQAQADAHGDDGDGERRDELERERGDEGELQDTQRRLGKGIAEARDLRALRRGTSEQLERRQRAQQLAERLCERLHALPLHPARFPRHAADEIEQERRDG